MAQRAKQPPLLFVDTNIWLDFYRARSEAALSLLHRLEKLKDRIIVTYQLEMEVKKNRQVAMLEGMQELKGPESVGRPGLFSNNRTLRAIQKSAKQDAARVQQLKRALVRALEKPTVYDPVFKVYQRVFHKEDGLVLTREDKRRRQIRSRALRRFLLGCPPRKKTDTSIGDALNWEWMIQCAVERAATVVIVSRDADYGVTHGNRSFVNDHLLQEFRERVSRKKTVELYSSLGEALRQLHVQVPPAEIEEEKHLSTPPPPTAERLLGLKLAPFAGDTWTERLDRVRRAQLALRLRDLGILDDEGEEGEGGEGSGS